MIDLLSYFKVDEIRNLFLNLTNLTQSNMANIVARLEDIDHQLNIKQTTILIIDQLDLVKDFKQKGWRVALGNISKNTQFNNSNLDYMLADTKFYQQMNDKSKQNKVNIIINHSFSLADSKLDKKLEDMQYINDNKVNFLFIDFTSVYDK